MCLFSADFRIIIFSVILLLEAINTNTAIEAPYLIFKIISDNV